METLFQDFKFRIIDFFEKQGGKARSIHEDLQHSRHIIEIYSSENNLIFYVKESNLENGFWGLSHHYADRIERTRSTWFLVLLLRSSEVGYLLPGKTVIQFINEQRWSVDQKGEYKIHENELPSSSLFSSFDIFTARVNAYLG